MAETCSPPPTSKEIASLRFRGAVMHVGIANPRPRGKRSWNSRRMRNLRLYVFLIEARHVTMNTRNEKFASFHVSILYMFMQQIHI